MDSSASTRDGIENGTRHTYCRICDAQCGLIATVEDGVIKKLVPNRDHLHSHGHVCIKGTAFKDVVHDPARVLYPLKRVGGPGEFERVSWDEALDDIAARLTSILERHGPEAFAVYVGNPSAYSSFNLLYAAGFGAAVGSEKLYSSSSQDSNAQLKANEILFGAPFPFPIPDLPQTDVLFMFGANPLVASGSILSAPVIFNDLNEIHKRGRVVVFDPRRTETAAAYDHVAVRPATDAWVLAAMLKIIIDGGYHDPEFLATRTSGWEALFSVLDKVSVEQAAERSGVSVERLTELALLFARTPRASTYGRVGIGRNRYATLSNMLLNLLTIVTGKFGRPGSSGFGYRLNRSASPDLMGSEGRPPAKTRIGGFPAAAGHLATTMLAADITEPGADKVRAMMSLCGNPVLSAANGTELADALEGLELYFAIDLYQTETTSHADYILPATTFLERRDQASGLTGLMVRPHLLATDRVIEPRGEAREEHEIFFDLTRRMKLGSPLPMVPLPDFLAEKGHSADHHTLEDMVIRLSDEGDAYGEKQGGLTLQKLIDEYPNGYPLPPRELLCDTFEQIANPGGRIVLDGPLVDEIHRLCADNPTLGENELLLIGRRNIRTINSWMHNVGRLARSLKPTLLVHPDDARKHGLVNECLVKLTTKVASIIVTVEISDEVMPGVVSYPHGYGHAGSGWPTASGIGGANVNRLLSTAIEDVERLSGSTIMDGVPVQISPIGREDALAS